MGLRKAVAGFIHTAVTRADGWYNAVTGLGGTKDRLFNHVVGNVRILTEGELEAMYHGDDLAATIVDAPIEHAMMLGFSMAEDEDGSMADALQSWEVKDRIKDAAIWGRLYGGGAILLGVNRGPMDTPLDLEQVREGDLEYLLVLDRRDLAPISWDPETGDPDVYQVTKPGNAYTGRGSSNVHVSRLLMFGGARTSERMKQRNSGWDLSVLQRPYNTLRDADANWKSVSHLLSQASQAVFKVKGLIDMIAEGDAETMANRMAIVDMARSVARAVVVDADTEEFEQVGAANVTGVEKILEKTFQRLAAAARMPVTILMGMSPSGMNATGEADMRSWFNVLATVREELEPTLVDLLKVIAASEGIQIPEEPTVKWPSFWQMSPTEEAAYRKTVAETDKAYVDMGAILPEEVTVGHWLSGEYQADISGAVDAKAREKILKDEIADLVDPPPAPEPPMPPPPPGAPEDPEEGEEGEDGPEEEDENGRGTPASTGG